MNILLITPGINKKFNDNYHAYKYIADRNNNILAISNKENINKGGRLITDPEFEIDDSLVINRIFNTMRDQQSFFARLYYKNKLKKIVSDFRPDIIFCEEISNLRFALQIKRELKIPVVLRTEFAFDVNFPYRSMGRLLKIFKNPLTGDRIPIFLGSLIWKWAYSNSDAVISCYFEDAVKQPEVQGTPFYYVPWPSFLPSIDKRDKRKNHRAVFIGAFDNHKNLKELLVTIPKLLEETPLKEFCIVGTGENLSVIEELNSKYPQSIKYSQSLSRKDCLELIRDSFFSYSPATRGGWGFIGDSWAMGTPVVVTHNHYGFNNDVDSAVTSCNEIVNRVNSLYENKNEYERLAEGGHDRFLKHHTSKAVGSRFLDICELVTQSDP